MDPSTMMQYFEDMRKAMCDEYASINGDQYDFLDQQFALHEEMHPAQPRSPMAEYRFEHEENVNGFNLFNQNISPPRDRLSEKDESKVNNEEYKESDGGYKKVKAQLKWESKWDYEDDDSNSKSKHVLTNKERAKIARKRKKQYYEDLESRNHYLEDKVKQLTKELVYYKSKCSSWEQEDRSSPTIDIEQKLKPYKVENDWIKMVKCWPQETDIFKISNKISESCRPYNPNKIAIMDNAFQVIMDSMLCEGSKLMLYCADKDLPKTKSEYESYRKLGKFQRHSKYPDPLVRLFIENILLINYSNEQWTNFYKNELQIIKEFKKEVSDSISSLLESKFKIYKSLMMFDLIKTKIQSKSISKSQVMNLAANTKLKDIKITFDKVFNIQKKDMEVERRIHFVDPKAFAKAAVHGVERDPNGEVPKSVTDTYNATLMSWYI
jgi:hypothetical protein